jgi:DNA-binding IclR family transcriptional regulator
MESEMMEVKPYRAHARAEDAPADKGGSVAATLALLRLLGSSGRAVGVNAIARDLSLPPSSCFKILKQLQRDEFVDFDVRTKCYTLGSGAIELARRALDPTQAFSLVRERLEQVAESGALAICFWRAIRQSRLVLAGFVEGGSPMRIHMSVGQRMPILVGAVGRAAAAKREFSEAELRTEFAQLRWQATPDFNDYVAQVREARRCGYGVDRDNFAAGVTTVAVVISGPGGAVSYGISGIMFSGRCNEEMITKIGKDLVEVADWASPRLVAR